MDTKKLFTETADGMTVDRAAFGLEIKKYRLRHQWTQKQLGERWGLSRYTIIRAEKAQNITWESAYKLAAKLASDMAKDEISVL